MWQNTVQLNVSQELKTNANNRSRGIRVNMAIIKVDKIEKQKNRISVFYNVSDDIKQYFNTNEECFYAEYSVDIQSVPDSIAVIPFVANVLPIVWLTDATLELNELDKDFYESIPCFKHGYKLITPQFNWKGYLSVNRIVNNTHNVKRDAVGSLFSGGVDAFATLIAHVAEKPILITLRGSDVKLSDIDGWKVVENHVETTVAEFGLPKPVYITSNFRCIINEGVLDGLVRKANDGYWHGFQHGIGINSHTAPIAYLYDLKTVYMASSFTVDKCSRIASDPAIDSLVRFCGTNVWHDQYHLDRNGKVALITDYCSDKKISVVLRVCWQSLGGHNCCECEKCIRTIFNILANNKNPKDYGFNYTEAQERNMESVVTRDLLKHPHRRLEWNSIKAKIIKNNLLKDNERLNWIYTIDVNKTLPLSTRAVSFAKRIVKSGLYRAKKLLNSK